MFSKFKAGEITAEEVRDEWNKVDGIVFADPRPVNIPTDILKEIEDKKGKQIFIPKSKNK